MKNLIPHFIQDQMQAGASHGAFDAFAFFVDLSGFTKLTETLLNQGKTGAERLSNILKNIFEPMVKLVYEHGGFIPYFAGDAFTGIFSTEKTSVGAEEVLALTQRIFKLLAAASEGFKEFQIGIKAGISAGTVEWGIVGQAHKSFYFRGIPIEGSAECQSFAKNGQIILAEPFLQRLSVKVGLEPLPKAGYFLLNNKEVPIAIGIPLPAGASQRQAANLLPEIVSQFLPEAVIEFNQQGEFRTVVSAFIAFEGADDHPSLDAFVSVVLEQLHNFSGYFKEIDFGDKGGVLVALFGAPVSYENNVERVLEFACALHDELQPQLLATDLRYKIGIASGIAYTGLVGGEARSQYAAVGNRVNVAARIMMNADWGEVLTDGEVQKNRHFRFQHKGDIRYKGLKDPIPTYRLIGRNMEQGRRFDGAMVGRINETQRLTDFALEVFERHQLGVAYVYGEPGIGKTRLSFELRNRLRKHRRISWLTCQSDQILRKPFNPFIYFLKNYFEQSSDHSPQANLESFERQFACLLEDLMEITGQEAESVKREIVRTKPVLAALVGLKTANTLWDNLDARGRYQNTLAALNAVFLAEALLEPLVIELEDGHWFDESSTQFINEFVGRAKNHPVLLLVTSRYDDEGNKLKLISPDILEKNSLPQLETDLNMLDGESLNTFACERLGSIIDPSLHELLVRTTNGNPFYAEQMLEYFSESALLEPSETGWTVKDQTIGISDSISAVLTARIDRLSTLVKETIKAAAVIGREFEVPILTEVMMANDEMNRHNGNTQVVLKEQIQTAERAQIWQAMNELRYIFRHSLLREAVYDMQLKVRLRELHRHIAEAIEKLYADHLEQRYVDLVFHYEQAEIEVKLIEYLHKAADYAKAHYQNPQALHLYTKLLALLEKEKDHDERAKILLKRGSILELTGRWEECEADYRSALDLARQVNENRLLGRANNNLGYLLTLKGKYDEADGFLETAAAFFGSIHDNRGTSKVYGNLGTLYFRQGKYEDAKLYFIRSIQLAQLYKHTPTIAQIVATLGLTYMNLGKYDDGIRWQQSQLELCQKENDRQGMATLYVNMGIVYFEKGDYSAALNCHQKGLALAEEFGNKQLTAIAIGSIGNVWQRMGKFDLAMENFERDLDLVEEMGDRQGICIALGLIGELHSIRGNFDRAIEYMRRNLAIGEELGYRKGVAKSLNTLGDIYFYKNDFETSLDYYDRSITVTRGIGNRLVLGYSLAEKGRVLLALNHLDNTLLHVREATDIAKELNHPDLLLEVKLLGARLLGAQGEVEEATTLLLDLLKENPSKREEAAIHYKLNKIGAGEEHREKALALYRELYAATPMYLFSLRMEELGG